MEIDWIRGFAGGLVIGLGGAVYLLMNGRIMGASGILGGLVDRSGRDTALERSSFLLGVILLPLLLIPFVSFPAETFLTDNLLIVASAGLLVGFGTRIANGCTSGHGVCGISRLSLRGVAATVVFIAAGMATVALFRHVLGVI